MAKKSIQEVILTNFKRHKHVAIDVKGNSFIISGPNGIGKSSLFQAIDHMLREEPLPDAAVTEGEDDGEIQILIANNGDRYKVIRKFTKSKMGRYELKRDAGNGRFDSITPARERFQEIFGNVLDLSPLIDMNGKEQMEYIQKTIGKDSGVAERLETIKANVKKYREERLMVGRDKRDYEAKMNVPEFRELVNYVGEDKKVIADIEAKKVDITELYEEKNREDLRNSYADEQIVKLKSIKVNDPEISVAIENLIQLFIKKKVDTEELRLKIEEKKALNEQIDAEIKEAEEFNRKVDRSAEFTSIKNGIKEKEKEYSDYTEKIENELASINVELAKLGFGEVYPELSLEYVIGEEGVTKEGLYLRGLPFNRRQQSYGEMVKVLLCLSKALNPDGFNFVKIGDWNLLDQANQDAILLIAQENDVQLGIEKVDESQRIEIHLIEK